MSNIDYGLGRTNIDRSTGIRYGVLPQNDILQSWCDCAEPDYGSPTCPKCGNDAIEIVGASADDIAGDDAEHDDDCASHDTARQFECDCSASDTDSDRWAHAKYNSADYACPHCHYVFGPESAFGDEPLAFTLDDGEYRAECDDSGDIFITRSPYYTRAPFCSPCAPGACYLRDGADRTDYARAYCFGADWFDDDSPCPYPVWRVSDDALVYSPNVRA